MCLRAQPHAHPCTRLCGRYNKFTYLLTSFLHGYSATLAAKLLIKLELRSLQSVKKILLQLYGIRKATLAVFSTSSLFLVTVTERAAALRTP